MSMTPKTSRFIGHYRVKLTRGRVNIPAAILRSMSTQMKQQPWIVCPFADNCIAIMSVSVLQDRCNVIGVRGKMMLIPRWGTRKSVVLSDECRAKARLTEGELDINGVGDMIQIWAPRVWANYERKKAIPTFRRVTSRLDA